MKLIGIFDPTKSIFRLPDAPEGVARLLTNVGGVDEQGRIFFLCLDRREGERSIQAWVEGYHSEVYRQT